MRDPPPLRVDLTRSALRLYFIGIACAVTLAVVWSVPLAAGLRAWLSLLVVAVSARAWGAKTPAALVLRLDGTLAILGHDGSSIETVIGNGGYLSSVFTSIVCVPLGCRRQRVIAILPDMLAPEDFRRLRVRMRYTRSGDDDGVPASHARASTSAPLSALD
ncbi:MAG: hypothetical protein ABI440_02075 [Casimicrobiaceae bacterium]